MSATVWKETLPAPPLHSWFEAFETDAHAAVHDLLLGRFDLANLAVTEPRSLLGEWVARLGNTANFSSRLDAALTSWIEAHWGNDHLAPRAQLLSVWETVGHVLSASYRSGPGPAPLETAVASVRDRLADPNGFSAQLFSPRGSDAFFACLTAAALYQRDDSLRALWWRLADLPDGFPVRYASVALTGVRRLPAVSGGFRYDVGIALFTIARALSRRVRDGGCSEQSAEEEFQMLHQRTRRQYPAMEPYWAEVFRQELRSERRETYAELIWRFLDDERGRLPQATPSRQNAGHRVPNGIESNRTAYQGLAITWDPQQAQAIKYAISQREYRAVERAEAFLNQQRDYARKNGLTLNLVQSLHLFASEIRKYNLPQAESWAHEETTWEPENVRAWNLLTDIIKRGNPNRAWQMAWATVDRFPFDSYARTELAEVLKEQGRFAEAEEVYRQMLDDSPENIVASDGLAQVLKAQSRLAEAEEIYRQVVAASGGDVLTWTGLANLIRLRVKLNEIPPVPALDEAENLYRRVLELDPTNRFAQSGIEKLQRSRAAILSAEPASPSLDDGDTLIPANLAPWNQTLDADSNRTTNEPIAAEVTIVKSSAHLPRWNATGYHLRLARAAFLRRSARRQATLPTEQRSIVPERLRAGARKLLDEVLMLRPNDSRAQTELAMLAMDENTALPELKGDSVAILAVAAQAARMKSKAAGYRLDNPAQRDEVLSPIRRLKSVHPTTTPLVNLQEGLAHLAMLDGAARLNAAATAFSKLRNWIRPHEAEARASISAALESRRSPVFTAQMWWSHALSKQLFEPANIDVNGQAVLMQADARNLSERLEKVGSIVSELELGYARHFSTPVEDLIREAGL